MVGCFGLNDCHLPRVPRERYVETNPRLDAWHLHRIGALADGTTTQLQVGDRGYRLTTRAPKIFLDGIGILIVWDEPIARCVRPWFECPSCVRRCRHVYLRDPIACKRCHGLRYDASRYMGQQNICVHRIARWRRQLGLEAAPFAPIPPRPPHHIRFHRLVERIRAEEARLVGHLQTVTRDLERRIEVRRARSEW